MTNNKDKPTSLYRYFDAEGELLYIGVALSPVGRLSNHRSDKDWAQDIKTIEIEWHPARKDAFDAETAAIKAENPKHNCMDQCSPNGVHLQSLRTRAGFEAQRRAGHVFGRRHSIRDFPERIEVMRPHIESGEIMTMHPQMALDLLNSAYDHLPRNKRPGRIGSHETFRRWRREGFPGYRSDDQLADSVEERP